MIIENDAERTLFTLAARSEYRERRTISYRYGNKVDPTLAVLSNFSERTQQHLKGLQGKSSESTCPLYKIHTDELPLYAQTIDALMETCGTERIVEIKKAGKAFSRELYINALPEHPYGHLHQAVPATYGAAEKQYVATFANKSADDIAPNDAYRAGYRDVAHLLQAARAEIPDTNHIGTQATAVSQSVVGSEDHGEETRESMRERIGRDSVKDGGVETSESFLKGLQRRSEAAANAQPSR